MIERYIAKQDCLIYAKDVENNTVIDIVVIMETDNRSALVGMFKLDDKKVFHQNYTIGIDPPKRELSPEEVPAHIKDMLDQKDNLEWKKY